MAAKKQGSTGTEAGAQQASTGGERGAGARKRGGTAASAGQGMTGAAAAATQGGGSAANRRGASANEGSAGAKAGGASSGGKKGGAAESGTAAPKKRATGAKKAAGGAKKAAGGAGARKKEGGSGLRADMREFAAARPSGWDHHDWVTFLGGLRDKGHDTSDADEIGRQLERERISVVLQDVPGLGSRKVEAVADRFGRLYELRNASVDEIAGVPGINRDLAEKISNAVR